jgi:hypothetical protein
MGTASKILPAARARGPHGPPSPPAGTAPVSRNYGVYLSERAATT